MTALVENRSTQPIDVATWRSAHVHYHDPLDEPAENARPERLAITEWDTAPLRPWVPNNTISYEPYDARLHVLGTQACADLQADFHTDATELAFAILAAIRDGADRLVIALSLMFAYARVTREPGITRGYLSYFSHATGFFTRCSSPESVRAEFDRHYENRRESLADLLHEVLHTVETPDTATPFVTAWVHIARRYRQRSEPLIASWQTQWKHLANQPWGTTAPPPRTVQDVCGVSAVEQFQRFLDAHPNR